MSGKKMSGKKMSGKKMSGKNMSGKKFCDNTYSLGKYSPNSKNYWPESGTPTLTQEWKGRGGESQGACRVSKANERGTEKLSLSLPVHSSVWGSVPLEVQSFFDAGLYSKWVCMQLYILIIMLLTF